MKTEIYETRVQGMICRQCEDIVTSQLIHTRGVVDAKASYWKSRVTVSYDPDIVSPAGLDAALSSAGYPAGSGGASGALVDIICLAAMVGLFFAFKYLPGKIVVPKAEAGATLGFLFVIGLLTGTHCIGMCGGIMLSQTTGAASAGGRRQGLLAALSYNGGRVATAVAAGAVFGGVGAVVSYTTTFKSILFTLAGGAVAVMGLAMWGVVPGLRALSPRLPSACELPRGVRRRYVGRPLIIGFLTGIMPCGASYAMWVYAMGTGSAAAGAASMLSWSLGTVPLMLVFGALGSLIPPQYSKWMVKISAVFVTALGLLMLVKGINLGRM